MTDPLPHLIIDGHNLIHSDPGLRRLFRQSQEAAREALGHRVRPIHDYESTRLTLVFDGRGERPTIEHPGAQESFTFVFAPADMGADAVIEQMVGNSARPDRVTVVSRDNLVREAVRARGALAIGPAELDGWIRQSVRAQTESLRRRNDRAAGDWGNRLPL